MTEGGKVDLESLRAQGFKVKDHLEADGPVSMRVSYFKKGDKQHMVFADAVPIVNTGVPIEELREQFGADRGFVKDPFGEAHEVILDPRLSSGNDIMVDIAFRFVKKRS